MSKSIKKHTHDPSKFKFGILKYSMVSQPILYDFNDDKSSVKDLELDKDKTDE